MTHPSIERLSAYLDGDLGEPGRTETERHLESCVACRRQLDELRELVRAAGALGDREPERDLWPGIERRLSGGTDRRPTRRALVAAALAVAVTAAVVVWIASQPGSQQGRPEPQGGPTEGTEELARSEARATEELDRALRSDPLLAAVAGPRIGSEEQALERALAETRAALAANPGNPYLETHLRRLRGQRARLLEGARATISPATRTTG